VIKVQTNKNIIFLFSVLAQINTTKKYHRLGKSLLEKLDYNNLESFKNFEELYNSKKLPTHPYTYCVYAINSNLDLSSKDINPKSGFGDKTYNIYNKKIKPIIRDIYKNSIFEEIYQKNVLNKYLNLTEKIQDNFNGKVEKSIKYVWNLNNNYEFVLTPNFLEISHSFGLFRDNTLYSITSPNQIDGEVSFYSQSTISNAIHEFSHSVFKKYLIDNNLYQKHKEITKSIKVPDSLQKRHNNPAIYMEETLIRVMTIIIQEDLYKDFMDIEKLKKKSNRNLNLLQKKGYPKSKRLYAFLLKRKNKKDAYLNSFLSKKI
jgi:hypothetical protein